MPQALWSVKYPELEEDEYAPHAGNGRQHVRCTRGMGTKVRHSHRAYVVHFGTESLADDGVQLTRSEFYARLSTDPHHPTTSTPPLGETIRVMQRALDDADHVIALTAPARLSGIYNIFRLAAEQCSQRASH